MLVLHFIPDSVKAVSEAALQDHMRRANVANRPDGPRSFACVALRRTLLAIAFAIGGVASLSVHADPASEKPLDGFNIIVSPGHPFGSATAKVSLAEAKRVGARAIAVIPFLWQSTPASPNLIRGTDMNDVELRAAIRDAHGAGLAVLVKPHVWIPEHWAGTVAMNSEEDWQQWFANYRSEIIRIARIAADEQAEALVIGTELSATEQRPEWSNLIGAARQLFSGRLTYMAHNIDGAEGVSFWRELDAIGVTLYPPLGADADRTGRQAKMLAIAERLDALSALHGKPVVVGEIGVRSAEGAAAKPWESTEERAATPDPTLQAAVIADWLAALDRPAIGGVLIWNWFTDPDSGGPTDADFTVQGKPAEKVLRCAWRRECTEDQAGDRAR
jgi:hypothetical protein